MMYKIHHPNAYIPSIRNIESGLVARTKVLRSLEGGKSTAKEISEDAGISYGSALHHLHLLRRGKIVERATSKPPYEWKVTSFGQKRLNEY